MDRNPDIETGTEFANRPHNRASRAPWDPPPRPTKPRRAHRGGGRRGGLDPYGGQDDDLVRGAD